MTFPRVLCLPRDHEFVREALPQQAITETPMTEAQARGWEQSPAFSEEWLTGNRHLFDVVHLHFGFEALSHAALEDWLAALHRLQLPLVFTVHDLRNPHHHRPEAYDRQLTALLAAAAHVVTLTPGAAREICLRFGREADVIPHPPLLASIEPGRRTGVVGISLKPRAQVVEPDALVMAALRGVDAAGALRPEVSLRVSAHPGLAGQLESTRAAAAAGRLTLERLTRLTEEEFRQSLGDLEVAVLPYRFGTHSGWLEACRDVGTRVVAPNCGYYGEQWDEVLSYVNNERAGFDAASLAAATKQSLSGPALRSAGPRQPRIERSRSSYAAIYDRALVGAA